MDAEDILKQTHIRARILRRGAEGRAGLHALDEMLQLALIGPRPRRPRQGTRDNLHLARPIDTNEGMSHGEIAKLTDMPLGTVKTHIRNGAAQLQQLLSAYGVQSGLECT